MTTKVCKIKFTQFTASLSPSFDFNVGFYGLTYYLTLYVKV